MNKYLSIHTVDNRFKRPVFGFTLIELMIVVAIISILAAIAYPNYTQYIQRARRADARAALTLASLWMERVATARGNYLTSTESAQFPTSFDVGAFYQIRLLNSSLATNGSTYTLQAIPQAAGGQNTDRCNTLVLTHNGVRTVFMNGQTTPTTDTALIAECWAR